MPRSTLRLVFSSTDLRPTTTSSGPTSPASPTSPANSLPWPSAPKRLVALAWELAQLDPDAADVVEAMLESLLAELRGGRL